MSEEAGKIMAGCVNEVASGLFREEVTRFRGRVSDGSTEVSPS